MSEQVKVKPTLILQQVPNENWVAEYKGMQLFNAYKYQVNKETRDSVYLIRLEPANKHWSYPVHMTNVPTVRFGIKAIPENLSVLKKKRGQRRTKDS